MNTKPSFVSVANLLGNLNDAELAILVNNPQKLKELAAKLVSDDVANTFFVPIADKEVPEEFKETVVKWRRLASDLGYTGPVVWCVREGYTLKAHAPLTGPCYEAFKYLHSWNLKNDETTKSAYVFWVPRLVEDSTKKNVEEQMALLAETCKKYGLSEHHLSSFGSAAILSGLILAHLKRTGDKSSLDSYVVRTDTVHEGAYRLGLGFDGGALGCHDWYDDGSRGGGFGCFPLGVELV